MRHKRQTGRWPRVASGVLLSLALLITPSQAEDFNPYQVKAAFLYNLTNFIKWPTHSNSDCSGPFRMAVLGQDHFGSVLDEVVSRESIHGRRVELTRLNGLDELRRRPCDLLFVSKDQLPNLRKIRSIARKHGILTVGDMRGFSHRGGIVNLLTSNRKIRIEINIEEARANGFEISAKLLRLAHIVYSGKDG